MLKKSILIIASLFTLLVSFSACKTEIEEPEVKYTISYISTGAKEFNEEKIVSEGYKIQEADLLKLSADGYNFLGWYFKDTKVEVGQVITKDSVFVAKWEKMVPKTYTVKFESEHGIVPAPISNILPGSTLSENQIKKIENVEGFSFCGWKVGDAIFDSNYKITKDITVTAQWTPWNTTAYVSFDKIGELDYADKVFLNTTTEGADIYYSYADSEYILYDPTVGISILKSGNIKAYAVKEGLNKSDVTSADYIIKTYSITFDNGGHGDLLQTITGKKKGDKLSKPSNLKADGFTFDGWYNNGQKVTEDILIENNLTLVAKWTEWGKVADVILTPADGNIDYKDSVILTCTTPEAIIYYSLNDQAYKTCKTDYKITLENDTTIKAYATKEGMNNGNETTVSYKIKKYTVTFENGGHGTAPQTICGIKKGETVVLPTDMKTEGYSFAGWYDGGKKVSDSITVNSDITLVAKWTEWAKVADVTFSKTGEVDYKDSITLSCATDGANIYYALDNSGFKIYEPSSPIIITDNITVKAYATKKGMNKGRETTAGFTIKTYTVTFDNVGHGTAPQTICGIKKGETVSLTDLSEQGFTFDGWYNGNQKVSGSITIGGDISLVAKWTEWAKVADVTFSKTGEVDYKDSITLSCGTPEAEIYYAIGNGDFQIYEPSKPIIITDNVIINAYAVKEGMNKSRETKSSYTIKTYTVTFDSNGKGVAPEAISNLRKGSELTTEQLQVINVPDSGFEFEKWTDKTGNVVSPNYTITEDLELIANWKDIAPRGVTGIKIVAKDKKVILSWTNPKDKDIARIIISCDKSISNFPLIIENNVECGKNLNQEITGLQNDNSYSFTVTVVDAGNNKSLSETVIGIPKSPVPFTPTETPKKISYIVINGISYDYIEFGDWPQSKYEGDENDLQQCNNINRWNNCYTDGQGGYYVKIKPTRDANKYDTKKEYYFKIEPIQWRVLTNNYNGRKLLLAEKVLEARRYDDISCKYDQSEIRAYLNSSGTFKDGGFLKRAFTSTAINKIADTVVDNSLASTIGNGEDTIDNPNVCNSTKDKIFLLSKKEVTEHDYAFDVSGVNDFRRRRMSTSYAAATGLYIEYGDTNWWLRSPCPFGNDGGQVVMAGNTFSGYSIKSIAPGIVPALSISF